jgi:DNA invertase Pin-like site-specific DNA recombinase
MTKSKTKKLRVAPLVRVSTERQDKGESMRLQVDRITEAVERLGGTIPAKLKGKKGKYVSQEHTVGVSKHERVILTLLMDDCSKGQFDAVMLDDHDRLGRASRVNDEFWDTLREHNIRFFELDKEYNLWSPEDQFILGIKDKSAEYFGKLVAKKSMRNRVRLAKEGKWAGGPPPYGRIWLNSKEDKNLPVKERWRIDPEKQKKIRWAAEAILTPDEPMSVHAVARKLKMHTATLYRKFRQCGDKHHVKFESKLFPHDSDYNWEGDIWIPPLLDEQTLEKLEMRFSKNKTRLNVYTKSKSRNFFALKGYIRCQHCGYVMFGLYPRRKNRYYMHNQLEGCHKEARLKADAEGLKKVPRGWIPCSYVNADRLERKVMEALVKQIGSVKALKAAFREAVGESISKGSKLEKRVMVKEAELDKVEQSKQKLIDAVSESANIDLKDIDKRMGSLKEKEAKVKEEIQELQEQLANVPTEEELDRRGKRIRGDLRAVMESHSSEHGKGRSEFRKRLRELPPEDLALEILRVPELARDIISQFMPKQEHGVFIHESGRFVIKSILPQKLIGSVSESSSQIRRSP